MSKSIATYIYKEAPLINFDEEEGCSGWAKVHRGLLNFLSHERKIFDVNIKDMLKE